MDKKMKKANDLAKKIAEEKEMDILREITMEAEMEYEMEWDLEMGIGTRTRMFGKET